MKSIKLLGLGIAGLALLYTAAPQASAVVVANQQKDTPTQVEIEDATDPTNPTKDPLDPNDPNQKHLTLDAVPDSYNFKGKLQNKDYSLNAQLTDKSINVFNDLTTRDWSVKANVVDGKLAKAGDASVTFDVTKFLVNTDELIATGATGIVAQAATDKTADNNTGLIKTPVTSVTVGFTDVNNVLKVGDKLTGTIHYQLYNTVDAS